jgi:multisubunit Na+/H+ antiporter MnhG subunit
VNIRDERSIGEQVRSGFRLAGWVLLTLAVAGLILRSEVVLVDRNAVTLYRTAGVCGLALAIVLLFVSVERWGKWFVGALGYWIMKSVLTLVFRPSGMLLQFAVLFICAFALCARFALRQTRGSALERLGMVFVVIALSFSLTLDSPRSLLIGVVVLAFTQFIPHVFRTSHKRARQPETS